MRLLQCRLFVSALAAIVVALAFFVWPTPYRYDRIVWREKDQLPVRINRFTGTAEMLSIYGWKPMRSMSQSSSPPRRPIKARTLDSVRMDLSQLEWSSTGYIEGSIYNPTLYTLRELGFLIEVYNKKDKKKVMEREYRERTLILPQTVDEIIFNTGHVLGADQEWNVELVWARREKIAVKTADDFMAWDPGLLQLLQGSKFRALRPENQEKAIHKMIESLPEYAEFRALPKTEQSRVVEILRAKVKEAK